MFTKFKSFFKAGKINKSGLLAALVISVTGVLLWSAVAFVSGLISSLACNSPSLLMLGSIVALGVYRLKKGRLRLKSTVLWGVLIAALIATISQTINTVMVKHLFASMLFMMVVAVALVFIITEKTVTKLNTES